MDKDKRKRQAFDWQKERTTQYNLRFMNETGVPAAVTTAAKAAGETTTEYLKNAVVQRLRSDGFLTSDVVLNLNKQRHIEKLARLEKYLAREKDKMK
jgi:prophage antirepressor-like protein